MIKKTIELTDLQLRVIEELDVLTDAYISTFSEIGKIIENYSEEVSLLIEKFIKEKRDWRLYTHRCFDLSYIPFRDYAMEKKFSLENLSQYFNVAGQIILINEIMQDGKKKEVDSFGFYWGFKYDANEVPTKFFYVEMGRDKSGNVQVFSRNEYVELANKIKLAIGILEEDFYELQHPDEGDLEFFSIWLDFKYYKELLKFLKICKEEAIEKFISKIKD